MKFSRLSSTEWEEESLLHVMFSDLIDKETEDENQIRICK